MQKRIWKQKEARMLAEQVCVHVCVRASVRACECVWVWDKQTFVFAGSVVQAVGRTAKKAEGPHKTPQ